MGAAVEKATSSDWAMRCSSSSSSSSLESSSSSSKAACTSTHCQKQHPVASTTNSAMAGMHGNSMVTLTMASSVNAVSSTANGCRWRRSRHLAWSLAMAAAAATWLNDSIALVSATQATLCSGSRPRHGDLQTSRGSKCGVHAQRPTKFQYKRERYNRMTLAGKIPDAPGQAGQSSVDLPEGRRTVKISRLKEVMGLLNEVEKETEDARNNTWSHLKGKWGAGTASETEFKEQGLKERTVALSHEVMEWLPDIISATRVWKEPLTVKDMTEVFQSLVPPKQFSDMRPAIQGAFQQAIDGVSLRALKASTSVVRIRCWNWLLDIRGLGLSWQGGEKGAGACIAERKAAVNGVATAVKSECAPYVEVNCQSSVVLKLPRKGFLLVLHAPIPALQLQLNTCNDATVSKMLKCQEQFSKQLMRITSEKESWIELAVAQVPPCSHQLRAGSGSLRIETRFGRITGESPSLGAFGMQFGVMLQLTDLRPGCFQAVQEPPLLGPKVAVWPTVDASGVPTQTAARTARPLLEAGPQEPLYLGTDEVKYVAMTWVRPVTGADQEAFARAPNRPEFERDWRTLLLKDKGRPELGSLFIEFGASPGYDKRANFGFELGWRARGTVVLNGNACFCSAQSNPMLHNGIRLWESSSQRTWRACTFVYASLLQTKSEQPGIEVKARVASGEQRHGNVKDKKDKKSKKDKKHKKADADSSGEPLPGEDAFDEEVRRLLEDDDDDAPAAVPVDALSSKQSPGAEVQKEQPPLEKIEHSSEDPLSKRPRTGDSPSDVNSSGTASKTEAVGAEETSFWDALHTKVSGGSVEGGSGLVPLQHEAGQPEAASSEFGVSAAHAALLARKMERIMSISGAKLSLRRNRLSIAGGPASVPALRYARAVVDRKVTAIDSVDDMSLVFVSLDWADNWTGQDVVEREEGVLIVPKVVQSSSSSSRSSFSPGDLVEFQSPETKIWSMATVMSRVASRRLRLRFSRDHVEQEVEDCLIRAAAVIAIFGDCRQRLAAEARILADFDSKSTGALAAWLQSPSRCARRLGSSGGSLPVRQETLWRLEKSPFPAQLLQATGCLAARFFLWPPVRPSSASGKVTQALPYVLLAGTQEQRWQALQILSTFAAGMDSRKHQSLPACLTGDCRTVSMPKGVLPVLMGKQMSGILQLMKSTRTFIFPLKEEDEKGADKDMDDMLEMMLDDKVLEGSCEVAIFGQPRARIGAELKIMALIEHERPGWITDKGGSSANAINTSEGFAIDRIEAERPLEAEPAAVGEPSQGELLAAASGCLVESAGRLVFLAGRPVERARAREYLAWVVAGRQSRISKLKSRADAVMLRAPQKVADFPWLTVQLARVGRETGTIAFFDGDSGGSDEAAWQRLIFAGRPLSSGGGLSAGLLQQASALLKKAVLYKDSGLEPTAVPGARAEVELEKKEEDDEDGEDSKGKGKGKDKGKGKGFKGKDDSSETKGKGKGKDDDQTKDDKGKGKGDKGKGKDDKGKGKGKMAFRDGSHLQFLQPPTPGMPVPGPGTPGAAPGAVGGSSLPSAAAKRGFAADGLVAPETPLPPGRAAAVAEVAPPAAFDFPEAMPATPAAVAPVPSLGAPLPPKAAAPEKRPLQDASAGGAPPEPKRPRTQATPLKGAPPPSAALVGTSKAPAPLPASRGPAPRKV
ncbi:unnamed protein product, partial [Polarella glacialis]